jgi:hypothetical protein
VVPGHKQQVPVLIAEHPASIHQDGSAVRDEHVGGQAQVTVDLGGEVEGVGEIGSDRLTPFAESVPLTWMWFSDRIRFPCSL